MTTIMPTVGRVMLYRTEEHPGEDLTGLVCGVGGGGARVNLAAFDQNGRYLGGRIDVPVVQDGEEAPERDYAHWMPYQIKVAAGAIPPVLHAIPEPTGGAPPADASSESNGPTDAAPPGHE